MSLFSDDSYGIFVSLLGDKLIWIIWRNNNWQGRGKILGGIPASVPLYPRQLPHKRTSDRIRTRGVRSRRLTSWACGALIPLAVTWKQRCWTNWNVTALVYTRSIVLTLELLWGPLQTAWFCDVECQNDCMNVRWEGLGRNRSCPVYSSGALFFCRS
jgi:hypothetical protein